jgi:hypothetical protein
MAGAFQERNETGSARLGSCLVAVAATIGTATAGILFVSNLLSKSNRFAGDWIAGNACVRFSTVSTGQHQQQKEIPILL